MNWRNWIGVALASFLFVSNAHAEYPERPIRIVVPFAPGGTIDIMARVLGERLTAAWKQPVVIENRAGAGGSLGADAVAKSRPDGYTLLLATNSAFTTNKWLQKNLSYDPERDFTPITMIPGNPVILVVNPSVPATNLRELIAYIKSKKLGELSAGSPGLGTTGHMSIGQFNKRAGVEVTIVPYRGAGLSLNAAAANEIPMVISDIIPAMPLVQAGKLRALATTGMVRSSVAPDVPTMHESGLEGFNVVTWIGLVGPAGIPQAILARIFQELKNIAADDDFRRRMRDMGIDPVLMPPAEFSEFIRKEIPRWKQIVEDAGLQPQ